MKIHTTSSARKARETLLEVLAAGQEAALRGLRAELGEYIRKQSFWVREPRGDEADSPWRVIAQVAGGSELVGSPHLWVERTRGMT